MTGGSLIKLAYVDKSQETREVGIFIFHIHVYIFINISNCTSVKLAAYPQSKNTPKKLESSPTTHVTETSFLHVLDPPDHFGAIYISIYPLFGGCFWTFGESAVECEYAAYFTDVQKEWMHG